LSSLWLKILPANFGNTTRKFQQIASESRYQNRLDPEEFESLCKLRVRMRLETGIAGCPLTGFEHANS
jgi:hypothetical protein